MGAELPTMDDVRGQDEAKAALTRAAETGEGVLLVGSPGCGKTMLARRAASLLPPLTAEEREELAMIWWGAGAGAVDPPTSRPFRAPHHTCSSGGLLGSVQVRAAAPRFSQSVVSIRPGEVSLAHRGVLFLDALPEFRRTALDDLATALRSGEVVHRVGVYRVAVPARPRIVIGACDPCPCGWAGVVRPRPGLGERHCRCSPDQVTRYRARIESVRGVLPLVVWMEPSRLAQHNT